MTNSRLDTNLGDKCSVSRDKQLTYKLIGAGTDLLVDQSGLERFTAVEIANFDLAVFM